MPRASKLPAPAQVALAVQKRYGADYGGYLSATMAYYAFFSLFPLMLLGLSIVGFALAGDPAAQAAWAGRIAAAVPGLSSLIGDNLDAIVAARAGTGIVGLAGLLWSGTAVTRAAGFSLSRIFRVRPYATFVKQTAWALGSTIGLGLLGMAGVAAAALAGAVHIPGTPDAVVVATGFAAALVLDVAVFLIAYRVLTQRHGPRFRALLPGAVLAGSGWAILKVAGSWYATRRVAGSSAVYGTFASAIGLLALLYLAARLFVYGAELSAVLLERRGHRFPAVDTGLPPRRRRPLPTGFDRTHGPGLETRGTPAERSPRRSA